jgi:hypothetical protein
MVTTMSQTTRETILIFGCPDCRASFTASVDEPTRACPRCFRLVEGRPRTVLRRRRHVASPGPETLERAVMDVLGRYGAGLTRSELGSMMPSITTNTIEIYRAIRRLVERGELVEDGHHVVRAPERGGQGELW